MLGRSKKVHVNATFVVIKNCFMVDVETPVTSCAPRSAAIFVCWKMAITADRLIMRHVAHQKLEHMKIYKQMHQSHRRGSEELQGISRERSDSNKYSCHNNNNNNNNMLTLHVLIWPASSYMSDSCDLSLAALPHFFLCYRSSVNVKPASTCSCWDVSHFVRKRVKKAITHRPCTLRAPRRAASFWLFPFL